MPTVIASGASLSFDPATHTYRTPDGIVVPSVTQILKAVGVSVDFEEIAEMSTKLGEQIEFRRALGTAVHADAHAYDDGDLDWQTVDPRVEPYLEAWATFRENTGLQPLTRERRVYHASRGYCGTLDGIFLTPQDRRVLVDIKTGDPEDAGARYQLAAYQAAFQYEHDDFAIDERWSVQLTPDRVIPYRVTPYTDWTDWPSFQAFLTTFACQAARRRSR